MSQHVVCERHRGTRCGQERGREGTGEHLGLVALGRVRGFQSPDPRLEWFPVETPQLERKLILTAMAYLYISEHIRKAWRPASSLAVEDVNFRIIVKDDSDVVGN